MTVMLEHHRAPSRRVRRRRGFAAFAVVDAASAWFGAIGLVTGWLSLGPRIEARLPLASPVLAGLALAAIVAAPCSVLAVLAWRGDARTARATIAVGVATIAWIVVQILVIRAFSVFQPLYGVVGVGLVASGSASGATSLKPPRRGGAPRGWGMRAVLVDPAEGRLVHAEIDPPSPGPGQLLVRVAASGVNRADLAVLAGTYHGASLRERFVAGAELAGEVVELGPGVSGWSVGDRVMAMGRGCAELAAVDAALAMPVPATLDDVHAGALPVALATMDDALLTHGRAAPGDCVVVNAASSGVGVVGVQIALCAGAAAVVGTSRSAAKRAQLVDVIGEARFTAVDPAELVETVRERSSGHGADVLVDNVGASAFADNLTVAAIGGRIVQVGRLGGRRATVDLDELARKRVELIGVTFRTRSAAERVEVARTAWARMGVAVESGAVRPVVHATYPLDEVPAAYEALATDAHLGKLVITVTP